MRVLVVEDEPGLRDAVAMSLREEHYAVDEAADGRTGLQKARQWSYDAIVLDLMLPEFDGWELLAQLRKTHATPVLILTARDTVEDRVRGLDRGADDYLCKPFSLSELSARVRALIRRSHGQAKAEIVIGSVVINTANRTVEKEGRPVDLTAREYTLVELLALNRGELVSRSTVYDHVFDENEDSLSNLVDVHIYNIRKKLGKNFVTTRRGHGYIIET
ncbi:Transcriptional regulatory protein QseB [Rosistilla carotiformis]|uniref:Transcriptional regulatory protein QseB n=1 Tax=Rosistilla carotiformis TaxID=2528017 RepID=A0A518JUR8_9BACT|nr:response regulator transcription factor [Rosistilla carotiformis]QDV69288.1 Transcriptional regulatory protein QseB [Rosistilla carotiformis]